jgi:hypothetical protein
VIFHSRKDIKFLSLVEEHTVCPKNVCKNLLHFASLAPRCLLRKINSKGLAFCERCQDIDYATLEAIFHYRSSCPILNFEEHTVCPKNVCKNLLHFASLAPRCLYSQGPQKLESKVFSFMRHPIHEI